MSGGHHEQAQIESCGRNDDDLLLKQFDAAYCTNEISFVLDRPGARRRPLASRHDTLPRARAASWVVLSLTSAWSTPAPAPWRL